MKMFGLMAVLVCLPLRAAAQESAGTMTTDAVRLAWRQHADPSRLSIDPASASGAQRETVTAAAYEPITPRERVRWIVNGTVGAKSLLIVGPLAAGWSTAFNSPEEWGQSWEGFGKRYVAREADVAISSTLEAGFGAIWGEDPRYIPSARRGIWPRARYAMKTAFVAQRPDGHLAPAWGRVIGNTVNNLIENSYLPPSITTPGETLLRMGSGFLTRLGGNLWDEFWPDARRLIFQRGKKPEAQEK
jgi:hypothetical protein